MTDNQVVSERLENILSSFSDNLVLKMRLLSYVAQNGLEIQPYLQEKARISLDLDGMDVKKKGGSAEAKREKKEKKSSVMMNPDLK